MEEEKERKMLERAEAERKHKQEIKENKIRRIQLDQSCDHFNSKSQIIYVSLFLLYFFKP